jgi:DNA-binding HxlR family transcriptional regulator
MQKSTLRLTGSLDPREGWTATNCSIDRAMQVVGTRSAFLLLREAFYGTSRFDDFAERVGISQPVAAARLRELVADGLLEREPYQEPGQRTRMQYRLTEKGAELFPVLVALMQWGDRWLGQSGVQLRHRDCGAAVRSELRCGRGHPLTVEDLDLAPRISPPESGRAEDPRDR